MKFKIFLVIWLNLILLKNISAKAGDIARKKCFEYAKYVYQEKSVNVANENKTVKEHQCGFSTVPLIIGGERAKLKEFPHLAVIGMSKNASDPTQPIKWVCGGSLISLNYILTAAHCIHESGVGNASRARFGTINLYELDGNAQDIDIENSIAHPKYTPAKKYFDIALMKLKKDVIPTPFVRPACLKLKFKNRWKHSIAAGFGVLDEHSTKMSDHLMKVTVEKIEKKKCELFYSDPFDFDKGLMHSQICAGNLLGGKDTCHGDSGGAIQLILRKPFCMYLIVGVTSVGQFCGYPNTAAIYTAIPNYIGWIERHVWPTN